MKEQASPGDYGMLGLTPGQEHMQKFVKPSFAERVKGFFSGGEETKDGGSESNLGSNEPAQEKPKPTPEKPKPQDREKEVDKEALEKSREEVRESLTASLALLEKFLAENQDTLDAVTKQKLQWAIQAARDAKEASLDKGEDSTLSIVVDESGRPALDSNGQPIQRMERVPVDGVIEGLELMAERQAVAAAEKEVLQKKLSQVQAVKTYFDPNSPDGQNSGNPIETFLDSSTPDAKSDILSLVEAWQEQDRATGATFHDQIDSATGLYNPDFYLRQILEASKQLEAHYAALESRTQVNEDGDTAKALAQQLRDNSKNYFDDHYGKPRGEGLTLAEAADQDPHTEHEANIISKDPNFRSWLVAKYQAEIPGFDQMTSKDQDYQLAMRTLRDRDVLVMPQAKEMEAQDVSESKQEQKFKKILLIDIDEVVRSMAVRQAEQKLYEFFKNSSWLKRMWKSVSESGYRYKFYQEALRQIKENNDLMEAIRGRLAGQEGQKVKPGLEDHFKLLDEIIVSYQENLVNATETGETVEQTARTAELIAKMVSAHASGNVAEWAKLGEEYANPSLSDRQRVELYVKNVIAPSIQGAGKTGKDGEGSETMMFASNFWQIAEDFKAKSEAEKAKYLKEGEVELSPEDKERVEAALAEHMAGLRNLDIQLGRKERDLYNNKPEGLLAFYEKAMDWSERSRIGRWLVNPVTVGIGAAVATRGAMGAVRALAVGGASIASGILIGGTMPVLLPILVGGAAGGLFRGIRTNKDLKYDLARERRNETLGGDVSEMMKESFRYDQMSYADAIATMSVLKDRDPKSLSPDEREQVIKVLAMRQFEKQAENNIDLFFDDSGEAARTGSVIGMRNQLDILIRDTGSQFSKSEIDEAVKTLSSSIKEKDSAEFRFRLGRSAFAGATAAVVGVGAGMVGQEIVYVGGRLLGLINPEKSTTLEMLFDKATGSPNHLYNGIFGRANNLVDPGAPGVFRGPDGSSLTEQQVNELAAGRNVIIKGVDGLYHDKTGAVLTEAQAQQMASRSVILEQLHREDWHGYGKNFHGKELQQWHVWDKNNSVKIDVHNMMRSIDKNIIGNHTINWDKTTDPKLIEVLSEMRQFKDAGTLHEHIQVRIFPTQEMYNSGQGINVGHLDSSGRLELSDELRNIAFGSDKSQLARAIEVGYTDQSGKFHVLNTAVGEGNMQLPEAGVIVEQMQPADYDWFVPLVPPGRKVYGRKPKESADQTPQSDMKASEPAGRQVDIAERVDVPPLRKVEAVQVDAVANRPIPASESTPIPKPVEPLPEANPAGTTPEINPVFAATEANPIDAKIEAADQKRKLNSLYGFFSRKNVDKLGDNWKLAVSSFDEDQAGIIIEKAKKIKIDIPVVQKLQGSADFSKQILDFVLGIDEKILKKMDEVLLVNPGRKKYTANNGVVLLSTEDPKIWEQRLQAFKRISVKKAKAVTVKPLNT